ncbi:MAG TPA: AI-2E family transporter [Candidatus Omnitrophota bacterium]|nr:AI-2E family transporter [Candidatus Omnitrophota bacterium]
MSRNQITRITFLLLAGLLLYLVRGALLSIVLAVVFFYVLDPPVNFLTVKLKLNRDLAIVISFLGLILILFLAFQFIVPPLADEFGLLAANIPQYMSDIQSMFNSIEQWQAAVHIPPQMNDLLSSGVQELISYMVSFTQQAASGLLGMLSRAVYLVIMPIVTYFMLRDKENITKGAMEMIPRDHKDVTLRVLRQIDEVLKNYIIGQAILCTAVGLICGIGCWILGVKFALILGIVAAIAQLIPNIGPLIAAIPALILASLVSPMLAGYVLILYAVVSVFTTSVLGPKVLGGKLNLHPLTVVISILVFGELMGVWGFFFAAPIVATLKILYLELRNP